MAASIALLIGSGGAAREASSAEEGTVLDLVRPAPKTTPAPTPAASPVAQPAPNITTAQPEAPKPAKELRIVTPDAPGLLQESGIYDRANDSMVVLQNPVEAVAEFPKDRRNAVDWVATLQKGLINPRSVLHGYDRKDKPLDLDVVMKNTSTMPYVKFPHKQHTEWLGCENCHPQPFETQAGKTPVTMTKILRGEYCGVCHDRVAFSLFLCEKCHNTAPR
ncbi:MAG: c(7)-type cytochrome triheme domain-containing protein [Pseudomonadota bacterium]